MTFTCSLCLDASPDADVKELGYLPAEGIGVFVCKSRSCYVALGKFLSRHTKDVTAEKRHDSMQFGHEGQMIGPSCPFCNGAGAELEQGTVELAILGPPNNKVACVCTDLCKGNLTEYIKAWAHVIQPIKKS